MSQVLQRAHMTVCMKGPDGSHITYDANHLSIEHAVDQYGRAFSLLSFLSSGQRVTVDAMTVDRILFDSSGASWCSECDAQIKIIGKV